MLAENFCAPAEAHNGCFCGNKVKRQAMVAMNSSTKLSLSNIATQINNKLRLISTVTYQQLVNCYQL